tara:strand:- start:903 stop:1694 length:792 start_codon:yes stop_codon:yes gene_type:complete
MKLSTFFIFVLFILFINQRRNISKGIEKLSNRTFEENINIFIQNVNKILPPLKIKEISKKEPIIIVQEEASKDDIINEEVITKPKDFLSPSPIGTTEYRFVDENPKTAWSNVNVSQHPKYYTSDINNEIIDPSKLFNNNLFLHDNTSPNAINSLPDRCTQTENNEVVCKYNNRLQLIPPKLITKEEGNLVLNSVGTLHRDKLKTIVNDYSIQNIDGNNYKVWTYNNESINNGGKYFNSVYGYENSSKYQNLQELNEMDNDYSF